MEFSHENPGYNVDLVMCIDKTGSMVWFFRNLVEQIDTFREGLAKAMNQLGMRLSNLHIKIFAFGDYAYDDEPMIESEFFTPDRFDELKTFLFSFYHGGGCDIPENSLEALALALQSDWCEGNSRRRHIIALFTDGPSLDFSERSDCLGYPSGMPSSPDELVDWYANPSNPAYGLKLYNEGKGLLVFAPEIEDGIWNKFEKLNASHGFTHTLLFRLLRHWFR